MKKKFVCTVCGYIHEGEEAPAQCPQCKAPASKFKELVDTELTFVTEHVIGIAKDVDPEIKKGLQANFEGECTEVGMYLAMSRQADREGYPEIAEAFKRYAFEEADHASRFCELLGDMVWDTKTNLKSVWRLKAVLAPARWIWPRWPSSRIWTPFTTLCMKWRRMKLVTAVVSPVCTTVTSATSNYLVWCISPDVVAYPAGKSREVEYLASRDLY